MPEGSEVVSGQCRNNHRHSEGSSSIGVPVAESEQIPSINLTDQVESVGQDQLEQVPEQPAAQDFDPTTAVAVMDPPVTEATLESAVAAEGSENSVTESVMDTKEQGTEPVDTALVSEPVGAVEEPSTAIHESASEPATTVSGAEESVPVAEEPQDSASPTDTSAQEATETIPVSEPGSMESYDPSAVAEVEPTEAAVAVSSETAADEVPTVVVSEPWASPDVADTVNPEAEQPGNSRESTLGTPPIPVEENGEGATEEKRPVLEPLSVSPIPVRSAFLPIQSAQNRSGYTLRGLF